MTTKTNADEPAAEIRSFIDDCLVPLLVEEYVTKLEKQGKVKAVDDPPEESR